jgi:3-oxoacyl-[acyl-carrier protein] reductase
LPVLGLDLAAKAPADLELRGYWQCDVGRADQVDAVLEHLESDGLPLVLIHAAGFGGPFERLSEVSEPLFERVFSTNVKSIYLLARRLLPAMERRGFGRLVNIASIQGLCGAQLSSTYVASKHALIGYTKAIASEYGSAGITCNAVCPGYVETPMGAQDEQRSGHREQILKRTPNQRIANPAEIADLCAYLVSESARHINGASLVIDGGISADLGI